jgi:hypothetical protein
LLATTPWTREEVEKDSERVHVFGNNLEERGRGRAGKLAFGGLPNAFGIPTKKRPAMDEGAFFRDDEIEDNKKSIDDAVAKLPTDKDLVYNPLIGSGLAEMPKRCP